jgi:hypothetical protein
MAKKSTEKGTTKAPAREKAEIAEENLDDGSRKVTGKMVDDFAKFKAQWESVAKDPAKSVLFFLIAASCHAKDPVKSEAMVTLVLAKGSSVPDPKSPSGLKLYQGDRTSLDNVDALPGVINSYLGGTPENGYKIDPANLVMNVVSAAYSGNDGTVHIQSSGKDFATPMNVVKDEKGLWHVFSFAPFATSVKPSKKP